MICSESSRIYCRVRGITSCGLGKACDIAFSINLLTFSQAAEHAYVILVMSPDTMLVKFLNSCVIILNCCKITVDWSWGFS